MKIIWHRLFFLHPTPPHPFPHTGVIARYDTYGIGFCKHNCPQLLATPHETPPHRCRCMPRHVRVPAQAQLPDNLHAGVVALTHGQRHARGDPCAHRHRPHDHPSSAAGAAGSVHRAIATHARPRVRRSALQVCVCSCACVCVCEVWIGLP